MTGMVKKLDPSINIAHTEKYMLERLPKICQHVINDLLTISTNVQHYCSEYGITTLCDCLHGFICECVKLYDLTHMLCIDASELIKLTFPYLSMRQYEVCMFEQ